MKHKQQEHQQTAVIKPAPKHEPWAEVCGGCGQDMWFDKYSGQWICVNTLCVNVKIMPGVKWSRR